MERALETLRQITAELASQTDQATGLARAVGAVDELFTGLILQQEQLQRLNGGPLSDLDPRARATPGGGVLASDGGRGGGVVAGSGSGGGGVLARSGGSSGGGGGEGGEFAGERRRRFTFTGATAIDNRSLDQILGQSGSKSLTADGAAITAELRELRRALGRDTARERAIAEGSF